MVDAYIDDSVWPFQSQMPLKTVLLLLFYTKTMIRNRILWVNSALIPIHLLFFFFTVDLSMAWQGLSLELS